MSTSLSVILLATVLLKYMQCSVFHQPSAMILMKMLSRSSYHRCPREDWEEWRGWQSGRRLPNQQWHSSRHWGARPGPWWRDQFLPAEDTVDQPDSRIVLTQVYQTFTRVIPPSPRYCPTATSEHRNLQIKNVESGKCRLYQAQRLVYHTEPWRWSIRWGRILHHSCSRGRGTSRHYRDQQRQRCRRRGSQEDDSSFLAPYLSSWSRCLDLHCFHP